MNDSILALIFSTFLSFTTSHIFAQSTYFDRTGHVHVEAYSSMMDVEADNYQVAGLFNSESGDLEFTALIKSFVFDLGLADRMVNDKRVNVVDKPKIIIQLR